MNVFDQLRDVIKKAEREGTSLCALANEAKVGRETIKRWFDMTLFPRLPTMLRVAEALEKHVELTGDVEKMVNHYRRVRFKLWSLQRERSDEQTHQER